METDGRGGSAAAAMRSTDFGLPPLKLLSVATPRSDTPTTSLTRTGWSLNADSTSPTAAITHAAPPIDQRGSWAERQVRKMLADDEWHIERTYRQQDAQKAVECTTLTPAERTARTLMIQPLRDFLEEGWLEAPGGLKAVDGVLLGGTGLGLNRFPAVAVVDERFKLSSFGQTSQPEWAAN
jgi:hypothetical protein